MTQYYSGENSLFDSISSSIDTPVAEPAIRIFTDDLEDVDETDDNCAVNASECLDNTSSQSTAMPVDQHVMDLISQTCGTASLAVGRAITTTTTPPPAEIVAEKRLPSNSFSASKTKSGEEPKKTLQPITDKKLVNAVVSQFKTICKANKLKFEFSTQEQQKKFYDAFLGYALDVDNVYKKRDELSEAKPGRPPNHLKRDGFLAIVNDNFNYSVEQTLFVRFKKPKKTKLPDDVNSKSSKKRKVSAEVDDNNEDDDGDGDDNGDGDDKEKDDIEIGKSDAGQQILFSSTTTPRVVSPTASYSLSASGNISAKPSVSSLLQSVVAEAKQAEKQHSDEICNLLEQVNAQQIQLIELNNQLIEEKKASSNWQKLNAAFVATNRQNEEKLADQKQRLSAVGERIADNQKQKRAMDVLISEKRRMEEKINEHDQQLAAINAAKDTMTAEIESKNKELADMVKMLSNAKTEIDEKDQELVEHRREIAALKQQLEEQKKESDKLKEKNETITAAAAALARAIAGKTN